MSDTIFAPATGVGRAAIAVVRLSGPDAGLILARMVGRMPSPRTAALRTLRGPGDDILDQALVLWMPSPRSFTGEDCGELHVHGGPAIVEAVCATLATHGARLAEPGEFTRRAFEAGRLDLTEAEAVADLVDAETQAQRRQAIAQLGGALSQRYGRWRDLLLDALGYLAAAVDFPDEDVPDGAVEHAVAPITQMLAEIDAELASDRGERVRSGLRLALVGAPNVGKSSLLNALAGRWAAIVNARPGTTRDVVEVVLKIAGHEVVVADTAGLRRARGEIEAMGVERARAQAEAADILLSVGDAARPKTIAQALALLRPGDLLVLNKADLNPSGVEGAVRVSAISGDVSQLWTALEAIVTARTAGDDFPAVTRARHRAHLEACRLQLSEARDAKGAELVAEHVRLAMRELERVVGAVDTEAVLDRVFAKFCIGK